MAQVTTTTYAENLPYWKTGTKTTPEGPPGECLRDPPETCPRCGEFKLEGECRGCDDVCPFEDKRPCKGWSGFCCDCGHDYAMGQIP